MKEEKKDLTPEQMAEADAIATKKAASSRAFPVIPEEETPEAKPKAKKPRKPKAS